MGILGRYLDVLSDEQRDRVIEAKDWDLSFVSDDDPSCRCLVGHAEDFIIEDNIPLALDSAQNGHERRCMTSTGVFVFNQFPRLWHRFGKDRIIRLCKQRAAKGNGVSQELPATLKA